MDEEHPHQQTHGFGCMHRPNNAEKDEKSIDDPGHVEKHEKKSQEEQYALVRKRPNRSGTMDEEHLKKHAKKKRKRHNAINEGFNEIPKLLPAPQQTHGFWCMHRPNHAEKVEKSIDDPGHLKKHEMKRPLVKKQLKIVRAAHKIYDQLNQQSEHTMAMTPTKLQVFRVVMDELFFSFELQPMDDIDLQSIVTQWIEEDCWMDQLRDIITRAIDRVTAPAPGQSFAK